MPYREPPRYLLCPRCTEMLEAIVQGVSMCPRCEGVWLTTRTIELAFGDPYWPRGHGMWWRNELACPECTNDGGTTIMAAMSSNGVQLDSCGMHGLWLDRGELGRVTDSGVDELAVLLRRLEANVDHAQLSERRQKWRSEQRSHKQAHDEALEVHTRAVETAERAKTLEEQRQAAARTTTYNDRKEHEALVERRLAATVVVARLEAKVAGLRAEVELRTDELMKARGVVSDLEDQLRQS